MNKAVEFAKEILKKKSIAETTTSYTLKRDTEKCVFRSTKELKYYCNANGLNYHRVMSKAQEEMIKEEMMRAFTRLP